MPNRTARCAALYLTVTLFAVVAAVALLWLSIPRLAGDLYAQAAKPLKEQVMSWRSTTDAPKPVEELDVWRGYLRSSLAYDDNPQVRGDLGLSSLVAHRLGVTYEGVSLLEGARFDLEAALSRAPANGQLWSHYGLALLRDGAPPQKIAAALIESARLIPHDWFMIYVRTLSIRSSWHIVDEDDRCTFARQFLLLENARATRVRRLERTSSVRADFFQELRNLAADRCAKAL